MTNVEHNYEYFAALGGTLSFADFATVFNAIATKTYVDDNFVWELAAACNPLKELDPLGPSRKVKTWSSSQN